MRLSTLAISVCAMVATVPAGAADPPVDPPVDQVFEVRWMQDFEPFLENIAPGTRLELVAGAYRPQTLRGVRGTAERPIVIRGPLGGQQPVFGGGAVGLHLIDCAHVVIDGLSFSGQSEAAIRIESSVGSDAESHRTSESIRLVRVRIQVLKDDADGVDIRRSGNVTIDDLLVRNWGRAAVRIEDSVDVRIDGCRLLAFGRRSHPIGIEVLQDSRRLSITGLSAEHRIVEALRLGMSGASVGEITIRNSLFSGAEVGARIGAVTDLDLDRCTFSEITGALLDFSGARADHDTTSRSTRPAEVARNVRLSASIIDWTRRPLATFVRGAPVDALRFGPNLWFGSDATTRLAEFMTDAERHDQVIDRDPSLDVHGNPSPGVAEEFGARRRPVDSDE